MSFFANGITGLIYHIQRGTRPRRWESFSVVSSQSQIVKRDARSSSCCCWQEEEKLEEHVCEAGGRWAYLDFLNTFTIKKRARRRAAGKEGRNGLYNTTVCFSILRVCAVGFLIFRRLPPPPPHLQFGRLRLLLQAASTLPRFLLLHLLPLPSLHTRSLHAALLLPQLRTWQRRRWQWRWRWRRDRQPPPSRVDPMLNGSPSPPLHIAITITTRVQ